MNMWDKQGVNKFKQDTIRGKKIFRPRSQRIRYFRDERDSKQHLTMAS